MNEHAMTTTRHLPPIAPPRTWDARLARWLVTPLKNTRIVPNHLTTLRLITGLAGAACLAEGGFTWSNIGALFIVLSNFIDHTDGELARISGKSSKLGHCYDLASDALVTVALFVSMGLGLTAQGASTFAPPVLLGTVAGFAVALIFYLRMRIESIAGKAGTRQAFAGGFETEDVLYLMPLVTLLHGIGPFVVTASIGAPLFAVWVAFDYWRIVRRTRPAQQAAELRMSR